MFMFYAAIDLVDLECLTVNFSVHQCRWISASISNANTTDKTNGKKVNSFSEGLFCIVQILLQYGDHISLVRKQNGTSKLIWFVKITLAEMEFTSFWVTFTFIMQFIVHVWVSTSETQFICLNPWTFSTICFFEIVCCFFSLVVHNWQFMHLHMFSNDNIPFEIKNWNKFYRNFLFQPILPFFAFIEFKWKSIYSCVQW